MSTAILGSTISYQLGWPLRVIGIVGSLALLLFIFELVRRRELKEEYTVLWVVTGVVLLLLAAWEPLLRAIAEAIGASSEASMLYFFGLVFVVFLLLHFSVRVSRLERRVLSMMQEIALLGATDRSGARNGGGGADEARSAAEEVHGARGDVPDEQNSERESAPHESAAAESAARESAAR
jgi:hypothetical protein